MAIDGNGQMVGQLIMEIHDRGGDTSGPPSFQDIISRLQILEFPDESDFEKTNGLLSDTEMWPGRGFGT